MRKLLIITALLLGTAFAAQAQEAEQSWPVFSFEISTGLPPIHMNFSPNAARKNELAELGQEVIKAKAYYPVINLTGVFRPWRKNEFTFTAGVSWCHHQIKQHPEFGIDPAGRPRYDWSKGTMAGWTDSTPYFSVTGQWRHIWTPGRVVELYSGAGWGLVIGRGLVFDVTPILPLPSLIPIGLRVGGKHFYAFAEGTVGTLATFVNGGLGWHF